ncbi:MAG: hypothetical protein K6C14_05815, partial [Eubacterium sp.]|nr:hypothetical protein [Eubacterium sp.]
YAAVGVRFNPFVFLRSKNSPLEVSCFPLAGAEGLSSQLSKAPSELSPNRGICMPLLEFVSIPSSSYEVKTAHLK